MVPALGDTVRILMGVLLQSKGGQRNKSFSAGNLHEPELTMSQHSRLHMLFWANQQDTHIVLHPSSILNGILHIYGFTPVMAYSMKRREKTDLHKQHFHLSYCIMLTYDLSNMNRKCTSPKQHVQFKNCFFFFFCGNLMMNIKCRYVYIV